MIRPLSALALLMLAACSATPDQPQNNAAQAQTPSQPGALLPLLIRTKAGNHRFDVEMARSPQEQEQGLMFRKSVPDDGGMLFPMAPPRTASFWMKNTLVPLDMLFIRTDGTIAFLKANATPYSREPVSAGSPVAAVLELRGGRAAELGIREEDQVVWGRCVAPAAKAPADLDFCPEPAR